MNEIMDPGLREQVLSRHIFRDEPAAIAESEPVTALSGEVRSPKVTQTFRFNPLLTWTAKCV